MKTYCTLVLTSLVLLLAGCPATIPLVKTEYVVVKPEAAMVKDCDITAPPSSESYSISTFKEKETALFNYSSALIDDNAKCNSQWKILRDWFTKQESIYSDKPK
jgi:uncharacterized protein YcfL